MKKQKSLRSLAKRVKVSARGKLLRRRAGTSHNMGSKSPKRKRFLGRQVVLSKPLARKTRKLLPHI